MLGMQRGSAGLALGSLGAGATSTVELAFLSLTCFESRTATLVPSATAACRAAQALDFPTCCD
jgi:hypothetical protein